ncbi:hypothetical protein ACFRCQ_26625 [Cytobacillus firmus]|uniref:hypothetical protein n=1 Tax=Cytobacillus firmus TaxID=1399 RepID=UPI003683AA04
MKLFNLFKTKQQKVKEACQDIHGLIEDSQSNISDMQRNIQSMQDGVKSMQENIKEYQRLSKLNISLCDEIVEYIDMLEGDK